MRIFLSYAFPDEPFVERVNYHLARQPSVEKTYFWSEAARAGEFDRQLRRAIDECDAFVIFLGDEAGQTQKEETFAACQMEFRLLVQLPGATERGRHELRVNRFDPLQMTDTGEAAAQGCAREIVKRLDIPWSPWDGIPERYVFDYEKDVIEAYALGDNLDPACPEQWPDVPSPVERRTRNPIPPEAIGAFRPDDARVIVDARETIRPEQRGGAIPNRAELTFRVAGPRAELAFPLRGERSLTVGILVSGGIAPGINAVIEGIVSRHTLYQEEAEKAYGLSVRGYMEGFKALLRRGPNFIDLTDADVRGVAHQGGSILGTSRAEEFLHSDPRKRERYVRTAVDRLGTDGVDILFVIGGDGSMRAAHAIWSARQEEQNLSVVAVPKTMDNDILWVWQAFGFLSAVDRAREAIFHLSTEIRANPRLCVIQLFGSDSGFVVSHAALASGAGVCDLALIPEMPFSMARVSDFMLKRLQDRYELGRGGKRPYGMVVMAETAIPTDVEDYLDEPFVGLHDEEKDAIREFLAERRRLKGQTPDALRTGGLKVVSRVLQHDIRELTDGADYWQSFRVFTNEPRHLIRAIPPSVADIIFGERLGALAVDGAMAGYTDFMVSQWLTEYVLVPLRLVVLGRKRVPLDGMFWKSALAMTGQPADLAVGRPNGITVGN